MLAVQFLLTPLVPAQEEVGVSSEVLHWTLPELTGLAETASPDLRQAAAEIEVLRGQRWQAGLYPNPVLEGGAMQLSGRDSQYFSTLSQEIVTKGKLRLDRAAAHQEVRQAELRFVRARFHLLTGVRQAFYSTLAAQQRVDSLQQLVTLTQRSAQTSLQLEQSGAADVTRGDTLLLEIEADRAELALENAEALLVAARRQLSARLGDPDLFIDRVEGALEVSLPDYAYELTRAGILSNSEVQAAVVEVQRNQLLAQRAEVQPFPNVTATAGYIYQVTSPNNMAVIQFGVPLPLWNRNQGNIHAARAGVGKAAETVRKTEVDLTKQLAEAIGRFQTARQRAAKYEQTILPKAQRSVEIVQKGFDAGSFDLLRAIQSQRALVETQLDYIAAQESRWLAAAEIAGLIQEEVFPGPVEVPPPLQQPPAKPRLAPLVP